MQKKNAVTPFGTNRPPFTPLVMNVRLLQIAIHYIAPVTLIFGQQARAHQDIWVRPLRSPSATARLEAIKQSNENGVPTQNSLVAPVPTTDPSNQCKVSTENGDSKPFLPAARNPVELLSP